jgi:hypothetical protein
MAVSLAFGLGFLGGHQKNQADSVYRYSQSARESAQGECVGVDPGRMFECVVEKAEASGQTAHDAQDLQAQQQAAWGAMLSSVWAFGALVAAFLGLVWIKGTLDSTREAVAQTTEATEEMREANRIATDNAKRQLRPYVHILSADLKLSDEGKPIAKIFWKNFGQTPALDFEAWTHSWTTHFPLICPLPRAPADMLISSNVLSPGNYSEATQPDGRPVSESNRTEIEAERSAFYVYGAAEYHDAFGEKHVSEFIYFCHGAGCLERGRLAPYMSGNTAT